MNVDASDWPRVIVIEVEGDDFFRERSKKTGKLGGWLMPTKNRAHGFRQGGGKFVTARQRHFRKSIEDACKGLEVLAVPCQLDVVQVCRQRRAVGGIFYPQPDSDATLTAIRDAIQSRPKFGGLLIDDAQIIGNSIESSFERGRCYLRITITARPQWPEEKAECSKKSSKRSGARSRRPISKN